jgi:hypothetical protein
MLNEETRQAIRQRAAARAAGARVEQFLKQVADKDFALRVGGAIPVATSEELKFLVERIYQAHMDNVIDEATAERLIGMASQRQQRICATR